MDDPLQEPLPGVPVAAGAGGGRGPAAAAGRGRPGDAGAARRAATAAAALRLAGGAVQARAARGAYWPGSLCCRLHYVEYLAAKARALDPIPIMDVSELVAELRRRALPLPERGPWDTDPVYAGMCAEVTPVAACGSGAIRHPYYRQMALDVFDYSIRV